MSVHVKIAIDGNLTWNISIHHTIDFLPNIQQTLAILTLCGRFCEKQYLEIHEEMDFFPSNSISPFKKTTEAHLLYRIAHIVTCIFLKSFYFKMKYRNTSFTTVFNQYEEIESRFTIQIVKINHSCIISFVECFETIKMLKMLDSI